jgi:hypothetical protein
MFRAVGHVIWAVLLGTSSGKLVFFQGRSSQVRAAPKTSDSIDPQVFLDKATEEIIGSL